MIGKKKGIIIAFAITLVIIPTVMGQEYFGQLFDIDDFLLWLQSGAIPLIDAENINATNRFCLQGTCYTSFPTAGGAGLSKWVDQGNYIEPNSTFANDVKVNGNLNVTGKLNVSGNANFTNVGISGTLTGGSPLVIGSDVILTGNVTLNGTHITDWSQVNLTFSFDINGSDISPNIINASGNVSAPYFIGDGSSLKNVNSSVHTFEDIIYVTTSGGTGTNDSITIDYELTQLIVTPATASTSYNFHAYETITGVTVDRDRITHTGEWNILKGTGIEFSSVTFNITNASADEQFTIRMRYLV